VCFVVRKITTELERVILITLYILPMQKKPDNSSIACSLIEIVWARFLSGGRLDRWVYTGCEPKTRQDVRFAFN
jgi:hypothetical protein